MRVLNARNQTTNALLAFFEHLIGSGAGSVGEAGDGDEADDRGRNDELKGSVQTDKRQQAPKVSVRQQPALLDRLHHSALFFFEQNQGDKK